MRMVQTFISYFRHNSNRCLSKCGVYGSVSEWNYHISTLALVKTTETPVPKWCIFFCKCTINARLLVILSFGTCHTWLLMRTQHHQPLPPVWNMYFHTNNQIFMPLKALKNMFTSYIFILFVTRITNHFNKVVQITTTLTHILHFFRFALQYEFLWKFGEFF